MTCFGIEFVLCDLYLKMFDLTKGLYLTLSSLLFGTNCVVVITDAGGRNDFTSGKVSPNLQARFCKLYPADFVGYN